MVDINAFPYLGFVRFDLINKEFDAGFNRHAIGRSTRRVAPWVTQGAATKLQHRVITKDVDQDRKSVV